ncbi:hypothetical protein CEXT_561301 [Caerostris extrusa]|uniref:Uncharacterized protein n=1 Tax=Caerostris extrusa TaxID=172846 RepID=A0AAV4THM8_CAEEX|nr:hypothetical protein CEXT_561301 [Caerostris extrusa]
MVLIASAHFYSNRKLSLHQKLQVFPHWGSRSNHHSSRRQTVFVKVSDLNVLYGNKITDLSNGIFKGLSSLQLLLLNANKISCLRKDTFGDLHNLNLLSLYDNNIQSLANGTFNSLHNIQTLVPIKVMTSALRMATAIAVNIVSSCPIERGPVPILKTLWDRLLKSLCPTSLFTNTTERRSHNQTKCPTLYFPAPAWSLQHINERFTHTKCLN